MFIASRWDAGAEGHTATVSPSGSQIPMAFRWLNSSMLHYILPVYELALTEGGASTDVGANMSSSLDQKSYASVFELPKEGHASTVKAERSIDPRDLPMSYPRATTSVLPQPEGSPGLA
ncbi:hypothetical protein CMUS01_12871 [Colletotrichum musicola]|uniref:Uncharacterized protein n=1 Tax=Colletotrichum musicola TaxID=2175873 RepID=A0A8H6JIG5_9PEZI|nr:hypothetical protein CMUS01_12871 [Colletotrichum musicola]